MPSTVMAADDACAAAELKLDAEEMRGLADAYRPHPVIGHHQ